MRRYAVPNIADTDRGLAIPSPPRRDPPGWLWLIVVVTVSLVLWALIVWGGILVWRWVTGSPSLAPSLSSGLAVALGERP